MTTADNNTLRSSAHREGVLARYPLVFFLLTFVISWGWGWLWQALQLPVPLIFVVVSGALANFVAPDWSFVPSYLGTFAFCVFLAGGPLLEEGGWRGFALPRLQRLRGPLVGTLILGVLWGLWHLPAYLPSYLVGSLSQTGPDATFLSTGITFVEYLIGIMGFSFGMSWVFNNTGGSVLMAILLHAAFDAAFAFEVLFPSANTGISPISLTLGITIVFGVAALVIIIATRGQLSYQREVELPATSRRVR